MDVFWGIFSTTLDVDRGFRPKNAMSPFVSPALRAGASVGSE
jgi:hypothetical protein